MSNNILYKIDEIIIDKENNVSVGDYIYINSDGKAEKALANSINTMPCVGRVVRVQDNKCVIKTNFIETDYSSVIPRQNFFISTTDAGEITDEVPEGEDTVIQEVGWALNNDKVLINIDSSNIVIRS
jgi:hypothetical protein